MKKTILMLMLCMVGSIAYTSQALCGQKLLDYGFEDWTGDADTTPGYIFYTSKWSTHEDSTEVLSSCGGRSAYGGDYFFHRQFQDTTADACLGNTHSTVNSFNNIGTGDSPDGLNLYSDVSSNILTIRYYFRMTDNWPNATNLGYLKFIRIYGGDGAGDDSSAFVHIDEDGYRWYILDYGNSSYWNRFTSTVNRNDGNWHSVVMVAERLNTTNSNPNCRISVYWDDWDMTGSPAGAADIYVPDFGSAFRYAVIGGANWSATYPSELMGIDLDKIEVWDGLPGTTTPPTKLTPPLNPRINDEDGDGYKNNEGDCNDSDSSIHPGAVDICGDGIDQDCDGSDLICP